MIKETCNKCGSEVIGDRKLDNNIWDCPNCGLEEYQSRYISKNSDKQQEEDLTKHYLNEEQTVILTLSEDTAVVEGNGKIDKELWINLKRELNLEKYKIEIKENIQLPDDSSAMFIGFEEEISIDSNIDTSNITDMCGMFQDTISANPNICNWDTSNVISMGSMFTDTKAANPNTENWNTSKVENMGFMFRGAELANPDVSKWDVSNVTDMAFMFYGAVYADPDTSKWKTTSLQDARGAFKGSAYKGEPLVLNQ